MTTKTIQWNDDSLLFMQDGEAVISGETLRLVNKDVAQLHEMKLEIQKLLQTLHNDIL